MKMIIGIMDSRTRSCEKCGGSLGIDEDQSGIYLECLMCGRSSLLEPARGMNFPQSNPVLNATWPAQAA